MPQAKATSDKVIEISSTPKSVGNIREFDWPSQNSHYIDLTIDEHRDEHKEFTQDVLKGLSSNPKSIFSRYFYDELGSQLFQKIMDCPEYYLTDCEIEIFQKNKSKICDLLGQETFNLIELGSGDGKKTKILLKEFAQKQSKNNYFPIDISKSAIQNLLADLKQEIPSLHCFGVVAEYFQGIKWIESHSQQRNFVLFMGSNIGNFDADKTFVFLKTLKASLQPGDFILIGFDLKKDIKLLQAAYDDEQHVTRDFNLNLLRRMNRELGANFDLKSFQHYATYNVHKGAMESYVISLKKQTITFKDLNCSFDFKEYEPIHLEYSFKFTIDQIQKLADKAGFSVRSNFMDSRGFFVDSIWEVV